MIRTHFITTVTAALLVVAAPGFAQDGQFALTNANIFNGVENKITANATIFIKDGKIERIATDDTKSSSAYTEVDIEGNYLIPGMFDVHKDVLLVMSNGRLVLKRIPFSVSD